MSTQKYREKNLNNSNQQKIAALNDRLRTQGIGGQTLITPGIAGLEVFKVLAIQMRVKHYTLFTQDNDPHGERDFGSFEQEGVGTIFWKIDYYDQNFKYRSEDPADETKTVRVLTIMLNHEY